jgi:hypothetical protein
MIRVALFLVGLFLMAISLFVPLVPTWPERFGRGFIFDFGLLLAIGSHGWPEGLH